MASIKGEGRGKVVIISSEKGGREKTLKVEVSRVQKRELRPSKKKISCLSSPTTPIFLPDRDFLLLFWENWYTRR